MITGVAFTGRMHSGKSTASTYLHKIMSSCGMRTTSLSIADPLKRVAMNEFGLSYDDCYTTEGKARYNDTFGMTNRSILQKIGEGMRVAVGSDVWVKLMQVRITKLMDTVTDNHLWVIDDLRYANEADMVHANGGIIVHIVRSAVEPVDTTKDHVSEVPIPSDLCDATIENNGALAGLAQAVVDNIVYPHFPLVWQCHLAQLNQ